MSKDSYLANMEAAFKDASEATRTTTYKAAVAHLLGYALDFQYNATFDTHLDGGEDSEGQEIASKFAEECMEVLNTERMQWTEDLVVNFANAYSEFRKFLER